MANRLLFGTYSGGLRVAGGKFSPAGGRISPKLRLAYAAFRVGPLYPGSLKELRNPMTPASCVELSLPRRILRLLQFSAGRLEAQDRHRLIGHLPAATCRSSARAGELR